MGKWLAREKGLQPVIAGDASDAGLATETAEGLDAEGAVNLTAATELLGLAAVLKLSRNVEPRYWRIYPHPLHSIGAFPCRPRASARHQSELEA